jgi:transposase
LGPQWLVRFESLERKLGITNNLNVGKVTAYLRTAEIDSRVFARAHGIAAFAGFHPKHNSGKVQGRVTISKQGSARLRKGLYFSELFTLANTIRLLIHY